MKEVTLRLLSDLALALQKDPRVLSLSKEEEDLRGNADATAKIETARKCRETYLTLRLERGEEDEETILAKKAFFQAKKSLEEEGEVASYRHDYALVSDIYRQLDSILFDDYRGNLSCKERHATR